MVSRAHSELLIKYGFYKESHAQIFAGKSPEDISGILKAKADDEVADMADHEIAEEAQFQIVKTEYPQPIKRYRIVWETFNLSIEESYFWVLDYSRIRCGYVYVDKTMDVFSAAENSAFFGVSQQRIGLQQDKVSQFLATIGKMVKELFQLVRELRILDERIGYYTDSYKEDRRIAESAEITLKGIFIDMVEQGAKNPSSVYGMARELQFVTLPDLFFSTHPRTSRDVDAAVDRLEFNRKVREVLKRKLYSFLKWKEHTFDEMKNRRAFTLKYLAQHWEIIRMYMEWVRPYLRHIKRLTMDEEKTKTPDLVAAFEGSMVEVEFLAYKLPTLDMGGGWQTQDWHGPGGGLSGMINPQNKVYYSCILCHFLFRTRPAMSYQQEGYNRGPSHVGRIQLTLRNYAWKKEDIENYKNMRDAEDMELMKVIGGSVKAAMEALGDELMRYLKEAKTGQQQRTAPDIVVQAKRESMLSPFLAPVKGLGELVQSVMPAKHAGGKGVQMLNNEKNNAKGFSEWAMWQMYKSFKREHKMMHWD